MFSAPARLTLVAMAICAASACDNDRNGGGSRDAASDAADANDGGTIRLDSGFDAGRRDAAPDVVTTTCAELVDLATCDAPQAVSGVDGAVRVDIDTTCGVEGPLVLQDGCGAGTSPQTVIAYAVPGSGAMGITFTMVNTDTPADFDTVVEVRETCDVTPSADPPLECFDDEDYEAEEFRSSGAWRAEGGTTLYFVVTGYFNSADHVDRGVARLDITAAAYTNTAPAITGASMTVTLETSVIQIDGTDAEANAIGARYTFLDGDGLIMDTNGDDVGNAEDTIAYDFSPSTEGNSPFSTELAFEEGVATLFRQFGAATVSVVVYDAFGEQTAPFEAAVRYLGALGEPCADGTCGSGLECVTDVASTCAASAAATTACEAATVVVIATPAAETTTTHVTGTLATGDGLFRGMCPGGADTTGAELLYRVTVPAGTFDMIARTDVTETADEADTVLYLRPTCTDQVSEPTDVGCADNVDLLGGDLRSRLEINNIEPGTYTLFLEPSGALSTALPFGMDVSLRPVLTSSSACDNDGVQNRCAGAACASGFCP